MDKISDVGRSGGATSPGPAQDLTKVGQSKSPSPHRNIPSDCPTGSAQPYRPSNGSEGEGFLEAFCFHCARDAAFRDGGPDADSALGCQILAKMYALDVADPDYPKELIEDERGSRCTAFTEDPTCPVRCDRTIDMFAS